MPDVVVKGDQINPNELLVATVAVKETASKFTYAGVNVGAYVTDDECRQVAIAVLMAVANYRAGTSI